MTIGQFLKSIENFPAWYIPMAYFIFVITQIILDAIIQEFKDRK